VGLKPGWWCYGGGVGVESGITQRAISACNVMVGGVTEMEGKLCSGAFADQRNKHSPIIGLLVLSRCTRDVMRGIRSGKLPCITTMRSQV
jgi:hypothetical protein